MAEKRSPLIRFTGMHPSQIKQMIADRVARFGNTCHDKAGKFCETAGDSNPPADARVKRLSPRQKEIYDATSESNKKGYLTHLEKRNELAAAPRVPPPPRASVSASAPIPEHGYTEEELSGFKERRRVVGEKSKYVIDTTASAFDKTPTVDAIDSKRLTTKRLTDNQLDVMQKGNEPVVTGPDGEIVPPKVKIKKIGPDGKVVKVNGRAEKILIYPKGDETSSGHLGYHSLSGGLGEILEKYPLEKLLKTDPLWVEQRSSGAGKNYIYAVPGTKKFVLNVTVSDYGSGPKVVTVMPELPQGGIVDRNRMRPIIQGYIDDPANGLTHKYNVEEIDQYRTRTGR